MTFVRPAVLCSLVALAIACSGAPPMDAEVAGPTESAASKEAPAEVDDGINRAQLEVVLREGPAWLLDKVPVEEVLVRGKFVGWRVRELPHEWKDIDLQPGDVVKSINGMRLETPTDFWAAWSTLSVASELKVAYSRAGEPREMSLPIYGQPNAAVTSTMKQQVRPPQKRERKKQFKTIIIRGERKSMQPQVDFTSK